MTPAIHYPTPETLPFVPEGLLVECQMVPPPVDDIGAFEASCLECSFWASGIVLVLSLLILIGLFKR